ncbi:MAG: hypothetical protein ACYC4E_00150 [Carboxydocellales bacterium]
MKNRLFKKNFNREHAKAHPDRDLKDTIFDLAEELREREMKALKYKRSWEHEKELRETLTTELGKDLNSLMDTARKKVKQAIIAGGLAGIAAGGLLGYLVRMYLG